MRRSLPLLCLLTAACPDLGVSSREVMFTIEARRTAIANAAFAGELKEVRRIAGQLLTALEARSVETRWDEPAYRAFLAKTRSVTAELTKVTDKELAKQLYAQLASSCQRCHDVYQYKK